MTMGMGNYPCYADTITEDFVRKICPDEIETFMLILEGLGTSPGAYAQAIQIQDDIETALNVLADQAELIDNAWAVLASAFLEKTGGLELGMVYHDAEDRGDELDGWSFSVGGVFDYTPAGKKYQNEIERKSWTVFG